MRALALVAVVGCGRVAFDPVAARDAASDTGSAAALCGGVGAVADNFDDGVTATTWYAFSAPSTSTAETGGELVVTLAPNVSVTSYAGYVESRLTDMRGRRSYIEVTQVANGAAETGFEYQASSGTDVDISERGGTLYAESWTAGTNTVLAMITYDPLAHRWWQLREDAGTLYFETSPDGVAYTPFATTATPSYAPWVAIELYAGTVAPLPSPGAAHYDNLNGGMRTEPWCKASTFADDFAGTSYVTQWNRSYMTGACTLAETGGNASITLTGASGDYCAFVTSRDYDMTGEEVFTHVAALTDPTATGTFAYLEVNVDSENYFDFLVQQAGNIACHEVVANIAMNRCNMAFDPVQHAYWRLRETGGGLAWETSPDGATWTVLVMQPYALSFTDVHIELGAGANSNTPPPGSVSFASYNE